jgi:hypothetical protein
MQLFNLDTMSGVAPGTRTQIFQRLQLDAIDSERQIWARLLWYSEPDLCMLYLKTGEGDRWSPEPVLHLAEPLAEGRLVSRLQEAAAASGWQVRCCGTCQHWRSAATANPDGLPAGHCTWPGPGETSLADPALALQSALALSCGQWIAAGRAPAGMPPAATEGTAPVQASPVPLPKAAEAKRPGLLDRVRQFVGGGQTTAGVQEAPAVPVVERSGVGAGTEPCFACQARLANLGALAVQTPEGDKQTFSIWRCRSCYTDYLNDWVDRWERLDSLETEETYYRVAPAEATELLAVIHSVAGGDHPGGRQGRTEQRAHFLAFARQHTALSHQIKQGR